MHSDVFTRVALALAGTGASAEELEGVLWGSPSARIEVMEAVRRACMSVQTSTGFDEDDAELMLRPKSEIPAVARTIDQMLRQEAKLSAADAVDHLSSMVKAKYSTNPKPIPPYTKNSFRDWLERLLKVVPASEVLHFAARIQNDLNNTPDQQGWHLRKSK